MQVCEFKVKGLFGLYNYDLDFRGNERVSIIHGINGVGKTTMLKLIDAIINFDIVVLKDIVFNSASIIFDGSQYITVTKNSNLSGYLGKLSGNAGHKSFRPPIYLTDSEEATDLLVYYIKRKGKKESSHSVIVDDSISKLNPREITSLLKSYEEQEEQRKFLEDVKRTNSNQLKMLKDV